MKRLLPLLMAAFLLMGCSSYYKIVATDTNRVFYTKSISNKKSGAITFTDANSGEKVTLLQCSQKKISKEEYQDSVNKQGSNKPGW